jgi:hypothetical protein
VRRRDFLADFAFFLAGFRLVDAFAPLADLDVADVRRLPPKMLSQLSEYRLVAPTRVTPAIMLKSPHDSSL